MQSPVLRFSLFITVLACAMSQSATAQEAREPEGSALPPYAKVFPVPKDHEAADIPIVRNGLPNIMVTGYWPPTNEMMRKFSTNLYQNPTGWVGGNWEGRGYNIYSFFPEFPQGLGKGEGDFEVDYQDTSNDWWSVMAAPLEPIAIITTGRAGNDYDWELEGGHVMYAIGAWGNDYLVPRQPEGLPLTDHEPGTRYWSSLPMQAIVDAVGAQVPNVNPYYTAYDDSNFLCNFIGYHATWYHEQHAAPDDPVWNIASGHIHVGSAMGLLDAVEAIEVTLRTLIDYLDTQLPLHGDLDGDGDVDMDDYDMFIALGCYTGPGGPVPPGCEPFDADGDGDIECDDWEEFKLSWTPAPPDYPPFFLTCDDDCNGNDVADEFDVYGGTSEDCNVNGIPDECDITGATSEDANGNGIPDECEAERAWPEDGLGVECTGDLDCWGGETEGYCVPPPLGADPGTLGLCYAPKQRYVSIAPNADQVPNTARRIKLETGEMLGWVGKPYENGGLTLAEVVASPVYDGFSFAGSWPDLVHVTGCQIAPDFTYHVQAIRAGQNISDETYYSEPLALRTNTTWGDTVSTCGGGVCQPADGVPGLADIMAAIAYFQGNTAICPLTWVDIAPSLGDDSPDQIVALADIMSAIAGFQSEPYPGDGPLGCP